MIGRLRYMWRRLFVCRGSHLYLAGSGGHRQVGNWSYRFGNCYRCNKNLAQKFVHVEGSTLPYEWVDLL